jgi:hypothetical protein
MSYTNSLIGENSKEEGQSFQEYTEVGGLNTATLITNYIKGNTKEKSVLTKDQ